MKKRFNLLKKFIFLLILVSFNSLYAETFRVSKVKVINLTNTTSEMTAKLGINESLAIYLPEDKTFIQGLEIKMDIPSAVASWPDCVACSIYNKISPKPT